MNPTIHTQEDVDAALSAIDVLGTVERAFIQHASRATLLPSESTMYWQDPDGYQARSIAMHAMVQGHMPQLGIKVINASIGNPDRGVPRADGVVMLFDPRTARITDIFPAASISAMRTAAVSTLAVRAMARPVKSLALIGAGVLARFHADLMLHTNPAIELVSIYDIQRDRAEALADSLRGAGTRVAESAHEAVTNADVTVAATTVTRPYVGADWLKQASTFINVSLDDLSDDAFLAADKIYVDDWTTVIDDERRALGRLHREGRIVGVGHVPPADGSAIAAELPALFAGAVDPPDKKDIVIVNPFGLGIGDIALAGAIRTLLVGADDA